MSLLQMSLSAAVMVLAVAAVRVFAINRLPKATFLVLWGVVLLRLLIPFTLPSPFSVYSLAGSSPVSDSITLAESFSQAPPVSPPAAPIAPPHGALPMQAPPVGSAASVLDPWAVAWLAGAAVCALYFALVYLKCHREFLTASKTEDAFITAWLAEHRIMRTIRICRHSGISAPLTYGIFRPVILIPEKTDRSDGQQIRFILEHEYLHIRRFDSALKLLLTAAVCIHWFNPLVWLMYVLANHDIELSCDEAVLRSLGADIKAEYALTLIGMEEQKSGLVPFYNSFSKNSIEERIAAIMKYKRTTPIMLIAACVLVLCVTTGFATSAEEPKTKAEAAYSHWGIQIRDTFSENNGEKLSETAYYYKNERVRIFMDMRADGSFENFFTDERGTVDIRFTRGADGSIARLEQLDSETARNILEQTDAAPQNDFPKEATKSPNSTEDESSIKELTRMTKEELPPKVRSIVDSCTDTAWYIIEVDNTKYLYYGGLPYNYAYQYNPGQTTVNITDLGNQSGNYLLLAMPRTPALTFTYNGNPVSTVSPSDPYAEYRAFGITHDGAGGRFYLNGELVRYFEDKALSRYFGAYDDGQYNVYVVRDESGAATGLDKLDIKTDSLDIKFREYSDMGLLFKDAGINGLSLNGEPIGSFTDVAVGVAINRNKNGDYNEYEAVRSKHDPGPTGEGRLTAIRVKISAELLADTAALDTMQRTGNWGYIEEWLPDMTDEGIDAVVSSYNSKHPNPAEHKNAKDYYN